MKVEELRCPDRDHNCLTLKSSNRVYWAPDQWPTTPPLSSFPGTSIWATLGLLGRITYIAGGGTH